MRLRFSNLAKFTEPANGRVRIGYQELISNTVPLTTIYIDFQCICTAGKDWEDKLAQYSQCTDKETKASRNYTFFPKPGR